MFEVSPPEYPPDLLPFEDRSQAGRLLAGRLATLRVPNAAVLALPRGGVPVAFEIARRLGLPLDVLVARKIGVPWQPELAMGAVAGDTRVLDSRLIRALAIGQEAIEEAVARERDEMKRREDRYRDGQPPLDVTGLNAILVDDGLATGNTMVAAVRHVKTLRPARIIVAVPVGSSKGVSRLESEADQVVCVAVPRYFSAVGEWYRDFDQVTDDEAQRLLSLNRSELSPDRRVPSRTSSP